MKPWPVVWSNPRQGVYPFTDVHMTKKENSRALSSSHLILIPHSFIKGIHAFLVTKRAHISHCHLPNRFVPNTCVAMTQKKRRENRREYTFNLRAHGWKKKKKKEMSLNESISCVWMEIDPVFFSSSHHPEGLLLLLHIWIISTCALLFCCWFLAIDKSEILKSHRNNYSVQQQHFLWHVNYVNRIHNYCTHSYNAMRWRSIHAAHESFHSEHTAWRHSVTNELHIHTIGAQFVCTCKHTVLYSGIRIWYYCSCNGWCVICAASNLTMESTQLGKQQSIQWINFTWCVRYLCGTG